jgi:hypothetical protein
MRPALVVAGLLMASLVPSADAQVDIRCRSTHATSVDGDFIWVVTLAASYGQDWGGPVTVEIGLDWASTDLQDLEPMQQVLQQPEGNVSVWDDARYGFAFRFPVEEVEPGPQRATVRLWRVDGGRQLLSEQQVEIHLGANLTSAPSYPRLCQHDEADLDGDGVTDVHFLDPTTGGPSPQEFMVDWRMVHGFYAGRYLAMTVSLTDRDHPVELRIPEATAMRLLDVDASLIAGVGGRSTTYQGVLEGNHTWVIGPWVEVEASHSLNTYLDLALFDRRRADLPDDLKELGWRDGTDLRLNFTRWDLDGDHLDDLRSWAASSSDIEVARSQSPGERRTGPVPMVAHAVVNDTDVGRRLSLQFSRFDGGHDGAWVEIKSADNLFRRLMANDTTDPEARPIYDVDLGPDAGFVEKDANGTLWVWLQHFSTREFTVVLPHREPTATSSAEGPGPGVALVLAMLVFAALARRQGR